MMSAQWTVGGEQCMNRGQDVLKQRGLFITNDGEAASQPAGQKGSGASEVNIVMMSQRPPATLLGLKVIGLE